MNVNIKFALSFLAAPALAAAPVILAPLAIAQDIAEAEPKAEDTAAEEASVTGKVSRDLAVMRTIMQAFDTSDAPPIAEDQLALARITSGAILPDGTYGRMMEKTFDQVLAPMQQLFSVITPREIAQTTGVDLDRIDALSEDELEQVAQIIDPKRNERGRHVFDVMIPLMQDAFTEVEPALREGLARAYARKFTGAQLKELNAFFKTPVGAFYAPESFVVMADPEIMSATMQAMPAIMEKVFAAMPAMEDEMKNAPKSRSLSEMDDTELKQLAKLLSVKKRALEEYRDTEEDIAPVEDDDIEPADTDADADADVDVDTDADADEIG